MKLKPGTYRWERTDKNPLRFARDKLLEIPKPPFLPTFHITIRIGRFFPDEFFDSGESKTTTAGRKGSHMAFRFLENQMTTTTTSYHKYLMNIAIIINVAVILSYSVLPSSLSHIFLAFFFFFKR